MVLKKGIVTTIETMVLITIPKWIIINSSHPFRTQCWASYSKFSYYLKQINSFENVDFK
ncbi:MAG: hypothetical protein ACOYJX_07090 [Acutalibacteraceae bacterium]